MLLKDGVTIACPDCGTLEEIPRLPPRDTAVCIPMSISNHLGQQVRYTIMTARLTGGVAGGAAR